MRDYDQIFTTSMRRVLGSGAYNRAFISDFYETFLATSPLVAQKFEHTDMSAQLTMLHDSLLIVVDFYRTRRPDPVLQRLAESHSRRAHNILPEFYDLWVDSLVASLQRQDPEFCEDVELAWRIALAPGVCYMRFAY